MNQRNIQKLAAGTAGLLLLSITANCGEDTVVQVDEERVAVVEGFFSRVLPARLSAFATAAGQLESAASAFAETPNATTRSAARNAWRTAMAAWQQVEVMQAGPLAEMPDAVMGEDLGAEFYSWPVTSTCRIDQETASDAHEQVALLAEERVNVRGLDAMEYLLFNESLENTCSAINALNAEGIWASIESEVEARRARYAATAATLLAQQSQQASDRMTLFATESRPPSDTYANAQEALNAISDALFYMDKEAKDMKLAGIAGVADEVGAQTRESMWANVSLSNLRKNLEGFEAVYRGPADGSGFETLLRSQGHEDLANRFDIAISAAYEELDQLGDRPVAELLASDANALAGLYEDYRTISTLLKTEFVTVLDLDLPMRAEGDND